jgi:predicted  nucleic acid-binding Zn-ribbon protein
MVSQPRLQPSQHASGSQHHRSSQQRAASREEFLWHRKLDLEEQTFDVIARINALQDKLAMIEEQKKHLRQELLDLQNRLQYNPFAAFLTRRPYPDLRLLETQIRRLVEEEGKAKADLSLAQHSLDSLNAKVAHLDFEISLL